MAQGLDVNLESASWWKFGVRVKVCDALPWGPRMWQGNGFSSDCPARFSSLFWLLVWEDRRELRGREFPCCVLLCGSRFPGQSTLLPASEGSRGKARKERQRPGGEAAQEPDRLLPGEGSLLCGRERTRGGTWHSSVRARSITGLLKLQRYANTVSIEVLPGGNAHTHVHKHGHTTPPDPCTPTCTRGATLSLLSPSSIGSRSWKH